MIEVAQKDVLLNYLIDTVELGNVFLLPRRRGFRYKWAKTYANKLII